MLGIRPWRLGRIARRKLPRPVQDAPGDKLVEALLSQLVPTRVEAALVLGDVRVVCVQGPMGRRVGHIREVRLVGILARVFLEERHRLVADGIRIEEAAVGLCLVLDVLVAPRQRVGVVEAAGADDRAVELVEPALQGPSVRRCLEVARDVPLAAHVGAVAVRLQGLRDRDAAIVEIASVAFWTRVVGEDADAGLMRMQPRQHRRARGAATRRVVEL